MGLGASQQYHQLIRKYIVAFGQLFADMVVRRLDANGVVVQTIAVPLAYAARDKFLVRLGMDPNLNNPLAVQLPALSFEFLNMSYDGQRKLPATIRNTAYGTSTDHNKLKTQFNGVPYNINLVLYVYVKNADDGAQILEQILPFFTPEYTVAVNMIPEMGIVQNVPIILNDVNFEDTYEGDFLTRRALIYTLSFTLKGYFYGPVSTAGVIKKVQIDLGVVKGANSDNTLIGVTGSSITDADISNTGRSSRIVVTPGLLANGSPTTNSAASVAYSTISANSNYGIATDKYFYQDGLKYDPVTDTDITPGINPDTGNAYEWDDN